MRSRPGASGAGGGELEAGADAVLDERLGEPGGERVGGPPAGAVRGHEVVRGELGERVAGRPDDRLEGRPAEVEAADDGVDPAPRR